MGRQRLLILVALIFVLAAMLPGCSLGPIKDLSDKPNPAAGTGSIKFSVNMPSGDYSPRDAAGTKGIGDGVRTKATVITKLKVIPYNVDTKKDLLTKIFVVTGNKAQITLDGLTIGNYTLKLAALDSLGNTVWTRDSNQFKVDMGKLTVDITFEGDWKISDGTVRIKINSGTFNANCAQLTFSNLPNESQGLIMDNIMKVDFGNVNKQVRAGTRTLTVELGTLDNDVFKNVVAKTSQVVDIKPGQDVSIVITPTDVGSLMAIGDLPAEPSAVRNIKVNKGSSNTVKITWTAPTAVTGANVTGYQIYRTTRYPGQSTDSPQELIGSTSSLQYTDNTYGLSGIYRYGVQAYTDKGLGSDINWTPYMTITY